MRTIIINFRCRIPAANLPKYKAETESFLEEIKKRPEDFKKLSAQLWERMKWLRDNIKACAAPPMLCRRINENREAWLDRCYREYQ